MANEISEITRHAIKNLFMSTTSWSGQMEDDVFLARLYDLTKLPSSDRRYSNAAGDIFKHCNINSDWPQDWVFTDSRFNLLHVSDEDFFKFLCETVHPLVRPNADDAYALVKDYNKELAADKWEIIEIKKQSGRPIFAPRKLNGRVQIYAEPTGWPKVDRQLQEMREQLARATHEEQCQTVGLLCREVLITVAVEVYNQTRHPTEGGKIPSDTDAKRMLEAIFAAELSGPANEEARAHAKAAVRLALALQHKRTADFRTAALCAEGTWSVVNMLAILAGRRGPIFAVVLNQSTPYLG